MALDITGFVTPEQTFPGLKEIGDTMALAVKQKAAEKKAAETGIRYLQSSLFGKAKQIQDPYQLISQDVKTEHNKKVSQIYNDTRDFIASGGDVYDAVGMAKAQLEDVNNMTIRANEASNIFKNNVIDPNKSTPGFNVNAANRNFYTALNVVHDESGNAINAPMSDVVKNVGSTELVANALNPHLEGYEDVWNKVAVTDVVDKAKPTTETQTMKVIGPAGQTIARENSTTLPSQYYQLEYNKDNKSYDVSPIGVKTTIKEEYLPAYKNVLGEGVTNNIPVVSDGTYNALNAKGSQKFLDQEAAKFENSLIKNGIKTRDDAGNLLPNINQDIVNFKKAVLYKTLDEHSDALGYKKVTESIQKAPSASTAKAQESEERDRQAVYSTLNRKWDAKPTSANYIDIKDMMSGLTDNKNREYYKRPHVYLVRQGPNKYEVQTFTTDPETGKLNPKPDQQMTLQEFRSNTFTQDPTKERGIHTFIEDYVPLLENRIAEQEKKSKAKKTTKAVTQKKGYLDNL
jgi:hypothetical protein